ncbi:hypothetical protein ACIRBX_19160 [Kitasatospora sp. NPDC096147]|uniref:hypothetical protein n=1 Tax=Kitasatospora sp. NPDC096147 TaxID=3364093 RepID=UPI0037FCE396
MNNRPRRWITVGHFALTASLGAGALAQADTKPSGDNSAAPFVVEDFAHPAVSPFKNLTLVEGDGGIELIDCASGPAQIVVDSPALGAMTDGRNTSNTRARFKAKSASGNLTLELPGTFYIETRGRAVKATLTGPTATETKDIAKDQSVSVGVANNGSPDVLVELRITG